MAADHPRSRGVYDRSAGDLGPRRGSSPLARGLPLAWGLRCGRARIIPARAGFTLWRRRCDTLNMDHPRSRGVYRVTIAGLAVAAGSSPLARGLLLTAASWRCWSWIIPARAGFTVGAPLLFDLSMDHPRSRGVYGRGAPVWGRPSGSSPLARGLLVWLPPGWLRLRIIPARAGFTSSHSGKARTSRDHPRSRGVYPGMTPHCAKYGGSSPLARGLPDETPVIVTELRIIPARAGFTCRSPMANSVCRDHPRSRGVYTAGNPAPRGQGGSSPLARGLRVRLRVRVCACGIIPARAGFTLLETPPLAGGGDHPRSRGVYLPPPSTLLGGGGSSPLARGLRVLATAPP